MNADPKLLASKILETVKASISGGWDSLTAKDRKLIEACVHDSAILSLRALSGEDVKAEKAKVDVSLKAFKVGISNTVADTIWAFIPRIANAVLNAALAR